MRLARASGRGSRDTRYPFDGDELHEVLVEPFGWELVEPLDLTISDETMATEQPQDEAAAGHSRWPHLVTRPG